jgi:polyhydroxyalkanoate synthase
MSPAPPTLSTVSTLVDAGANLFDMTVGGGVADLTRLPKSIVDDGPQRTIYRYRESADLQTRSPVLLVPPLAAPAHCFDFRRGCSVAEHLLRHGHPTYLLDYGGIAFSDRQLGLEHWVDDVIPHAVRVTSDDADGAPVQIVGWCLGGILSLLAVAADQGLPVASLALIASPFDFSQVRAMQPIRRLAELTGGRLVTGLYRALGGAPAALVSIGFQLTALDRRLTKPLVVGRRLGDRDFIAHVEATDEYMANMLAYPGRTFGQLYHRFFRVNELAEGRTELSDRAIDLQAVRQPVLVVAGRGDILAPPAAVRAVVPLLTNAADVRYEEVPGGHLGVLTGRSAVTTTWAHLHQHLVDHDVRHHERHEQAAA